MGCEGGCMRERERERERERVIFSYDVKSRTFDIWCIV